MGQRTQRCKWTSSEAAVYTPNVRQQYQQSSYAGLCSYSIAAGDTHTEQKSPLGRFTVRMAVCMCITRSDAADTFETQLESV